MHNGRAAVVTYRSVVRNLSQTVDPIRKTIYVSTSTDIYTNLAVEDWLYRYHDFTSHHILMLWRSSPCVVIGRHQNPWLEANVASLAARGVRLARRDSGGGTVYHDTGNLNLTFFGPKERYNRRYNLEIIKRAVHKRHDRLEVDITKREDLTLAGRKVSGTASKLGRPNAYHHCTLLVRSNKADVRAALRTDDDDDVHIVTNATRSVPSPIVNLCDVDDRVTVDGIAEAVGLEYLRTPTTNGYDVDETNRRNAFETIEPSETMFPGLDRLRTDLSAWKWRYDSVMTNFIMYRTCHVTLGHDPQQCALLGKPGQSNDTVALENEVQPYATVLLVTQTVLGSLVPTVLCLLLGPWSDTNGRKPVMLLVPFGCMLSHGLTTIVASVPTASPWWIVVCYVPALLTGEAFSYVSVVLCYVSDVTPTDRRSVRMGTFEAARSVGYTAGTLGGSYVLYRSGYATVFATCAGAVFVALLFTFLLVPESNRRRPEAARRLFDVERLKETVRTCCRTRERHVGALLLIAAAAACVFVTTLLSEYPLVFLYLRKKLRWDLTKYNAYQGALNVASVFVVVAAMPLLCRALRVAEASLVTVGFVGQCVGSVLQGVARTDWSVYVGGAFSSTGSFVSPMVKTLVSKVTPNDEFGTIFSVLTTLECSGPLALAPLYAYVYNETLDTRPGTFNFLSAGLYAIGALLGCAMWRIRRMSVRPPPDAQPLDNDTIEGEQ